MRSSIIVGVVGVLCLTASCRQALNGEREVRAFIRENMPATTCFYLKDTLEHLALPKPFSVPTIKGKFQDLYYWDTYFTNLGLLSLGDIHQVRNNVDDILYLIERFGYMPNSSKMAQTNRSQPPYASMMIRDLYERTKDRAWLRGAYDILLKEYDFWMRERMTDTGLNRYYNMATEAYLLDFYDYIRRRIPSLRADADREERIRTASQYLSEAESGWDFTPRFHTHCEDYNPIDLNANLYIYEKNFAWFCSELGIEGTADWEETAALRLERINKYCYDGQSGEYYDYNYRTHTRSDVYSAAVFNILWAGIPNEEQAQNLVRQLNRLEMEYGLVACEPGERTDVYQWDSPNSWASFHVLAIAGLEAYGYRADARRIAEKYAGTIIRIFRQSGNLWEKYNGRKGNREVNSEYPLPPFMGWTAGGFLYATDYLRHAGL